MKSGGRARVVGSANTRAADPVENLIRSRFTWQAGRPVSYSSASGNREALRLAALAQGRLAGFRGDRRRSWGPDARRGGRPRLDRPQRPERVAHLYRVRRAPGPRDL